jgi:AraC family L-rhamnose operon transcriptional activator RhaR
MRLAANDFFRCGAQRVTVEPRTPQSRFPLHDHEFNEIVIVMSGNGWHVLNEEPRLITCGEILYIKAEDRHAFEEVHDLYLTNVLYSSELLSTGSGPAGIDGGDACQRRNWQVDEDVLGQVRPLLDRLFRETKGADPLSAVMAESLFLQLAVILCRNRFAADGDGLPGASRLGQVLAYLRHNCTEQIDFDDVARRFGYSLRNFARVFHEATATTPHNYLVRLRLGHAMRSLRLSDNVTEVAFASGFNDSNYFSYAFRKLTGLSPSEYRRRIQQHGRVLSGSEAAS